MEKDKGDTKVRADFSRFIVQNLADQIKQADTKAFGIMGVLGILTAGLLTRLNAIKSPTGVTVEWAVLFIISACLIILALKAVIRVVYPRMSFSANDGVIYFNDILKNESKEFVRKGLALSAEETIHESYKDAYSLATIAKAKFKALRYALITVVVAFIWTMVILILSFR